MTPEQFIEALPPADLKMVYGLAGRRLRSLAGKDHAGRPGRYAETLAALDVGESVLFSSWKLAARLQPYMKEGARRLLNDPCAQWAGRQNNHGVRVVRTR